MANIDRRQIQAFLSEVGKRFPKSAAIYLLGGSALCLLGNPRPTLDIDYVGDDLKKDDLQEAMEEIAREMGLAVEAVPIDRFIPIPPNGQQRSLPLGTFGKIEVYIFDPYSIALSKIDRGFDTDIDDVVFLLQHNVINWNELEHYTHDTLSRAREFDIVPDEMLAHLQAVRVRL